MLRRNKLTHLNRCTSSLLFIIALFSISLVPSKILTLAAFPPQHPFKEIFEKDLSEIAESTEGITRIYIDHWWLIFDVAHVHIDYVPDLSESQKIVLQSQVMCELREKWYVSYAEPNYIIVPPEYPPPDPPFEVGALNVGFEAQIVVPDTYPTIQEAINSASANDTVFVRSGTYNEHIIVNKTLTIIGEGRDTTIIDGGNSAPNAVVVVSSDSVRFEGFTVRNSGSGNGGIYVDNCVNATLCKNVVTNNGHGIEVLRSSGSTVQDNLVSGNVQTGILTVWSFNNTICGNTISDSNVGIGTAFPCYNNTFSGNTISDNAYGFLVAFQNCRLFHNNIENNTNQVTLCSPQYANAWDDGYPSGGNYWSDYSGVDLYRGPYQNETGSDGIGDEARVIAVNNQDRYPMMRRFGSIRNLNTGLAYPTIQSAINAPETLVNHTIFVSSGTYYESIVVNKTVAIVGEDAETTIIDGNQAEDAVYVSANGVTMSHFLVPNCVNALRLLGCNNTLVRNVRLLNNSRGILASGCWFTEIADNLIENTADDCVLLSNCYGNLVTGNVMSKKQGCGLHLSSSSNNTIENNVISGETGSGGDGFRLEQSHSNLVANNTISNNGGYGMLLQSSNQSLIFHNNFINNTVQAYVQDSYDNGWDDGFEGNYWSNYNGSDLNDDGIGDEYLPWEGLDYCPLMCFFWNQGDINHDTKVDLRDVFRTGKAYGSTPGSPSWDPHCDINHDGKVDLMDYYFVCKNYGKAYG
jgi:parallel beta-helix repeat protein